MDVFQIYENCRDDADRRHALEDVILTEVAANLRGWDAQIDGALAEMEAIRERVTALDLEVAAGTWEPTEDLLVPSDEREGFAEDEAIQHKEWVEGVNERYDLFLILSALAGHGGNDGSDYAIDCAEIERTLAERRKRLAADESDAKKMPQRGRRGRPPTKRPPAVAAILAEIAAGGLTREAFAEMQGKTMEDRWHLSEGTARVVRQDVLDAFGGAINRDNSNVEFLRPKSD
jgi:hypothetical protein